jgi:hypothetical protein
MSKNTSGSKILLTILPISLIFFTNALLATSADAQFQWCYRGKGGYCRVDAAPCNEGFGPGKCVSLSDGECECLVIKNQSRRHHH